MSRVLESALTREQRRACNDNDVALGIGAPVVADVEITIGAMMRVQHPEDARAAKRSSNREMGLWLGVMVLVGATCGFAGQLMAAPAICPAPVNNLTKQTQFAERLPHTMRQGVVL